jgi:hypothetical protein
VFFLRRGNLSLKEGRLKLTKQERKLVLSPVINSSDNGTMENRRDCNCPCHSGSVAVHPVPCCDGVLGYLKRKPKANSKLKKGEKKASQ